MLQSSANQSSQRYRTLRELTPGHWQNGFVHTGDGATIHYTRTGGNKPALLLLHGVQAMGLTWLRTAQALEPQYDVIMPDLRGHGDSSRLTGDITIDLLVDDMIGLIRPLKLDNPFVVGHSMGADIAATGGGDRVARVQ